jgi:hypothetical protein
MNGLVLFLLTRSARWPPAAGWRRLTWCGGLFIVAGLLMMLSFAALCIGFPLLGMPLWLAVLGSAYQLLFRSDRVATAAR